MARPRWQKNREDGVPLEGDIAFSQGYDVDRANPHDPTTVGSMRWISDWWRANADAYEGHLYGQAEAQEDEGHA